MGAGQATGADRAYQELCRELLLRNIDNGETLLPYSSDGIDVAFRLGAATVTFDVALKGSADRLVVAECKRWRSESPIKQSSIAAFAYHVELLRKHVTGQVAGFFFTTSGYQAGAVKLAFEPGIRVAVVDSEADVRNVVFAFHRYDAERHERLRDWQASMSVSVPFSTHLGFVVRDAHGNIKQIG